MKMATKIVRQRLTRGQSFLVAGWLTANQSRINEGQITPDQAAADCSLAVQCPVTFLAMKGVAESAQIAIKWPRRKKQNAAKAANTDRVKRLARQVRSLAQIVKRLSADLGSSAFTESDYEEAAMEDLVSGSRPGTSASQTTNQ